MAGVTESEWQFVPSALSLFTFKGEYQTESCVTVSMYVLN